MSDKVVGVSRFVINPRDNSGEQVAFETTIFDNGDATNNLYYNTKVTMQSYCNSMSLNLIGAALTPEVLRAMADQIEQTVQMRK